MQPIVSTPERADLLTQLGTNPNGNHWNQTRVYIYTDNTRTVGTRNYSKTLKQVLYEPCVHGFIGKLADGSVAAAMGRKPVAPALETADGYDAAKAGRMS